MKSDHYSKYLVFDFIIVNILRSFTDINYFVLKFIKTFYVCAVTFSLYYPKLIYNYFRFMQNNVLFFLKI
jgi:hypothetical protein